MVELIGRRLGEFEVVRELGRGGMGVVYEATQVSLGRRVALKVLGPGLGLTPRAVDRFRREAAAAAKLHHTNIVPVYATGDENGVHFYAMELIDGPGLDRVIRDLANGTNAHPPTASHDPAATIAHVSTPLSRDPEGSAATSPALGSASRLSGNPERFDTAARMIADVADALHHAHQNGVTHRDIKPSNLLLAGDGRLSVTDFGLARMLEQPGMTVTGEFVGTPAYMSPEQITAGRIPVDHRADIYSLGATLYELLTLRPPFSADGRDRLLAMVIQKEPTSLRSHDPKIPRDLETICLKCLEKDPDRRYQSAKELADDLRRFVNRFAIHARRTGPVGRFKKWVKRNPALAGAGLAVLIALGAAGYFAWQAHQAAELARAEQRQAAVEKAILEAMSGDAPAALAAIAEAENKSADPGTLNLLRGLVERNAGRPKEAVAYLEQARRQLPESVAVQALLAAAYQDDGQWERCDEMSTRLERAEPKTTEDYLFLALILSEFGDPNAAIRTLDGAPVRARQSPVGRLARATAENALAEMTGRADAAERALDEHRRVDLPDSPLLLATRIRTCMVAAAIFGPADPRREVALAQARRDFDALAGYDKNPIALLGRCHYLLARGEDDGLLKEVRTARGRGVEDSRTTEYETSVLYARKQFDSALAVVQTINPTGREARAYTVRGLVLAATPGRKDEAERAFTEAIRACKGGALLAYVPAHLQLIGGDARDESRRAALDIHKRSDHLIPNIPGRWYHDLLDFHAGLLDEAGLLRQAGESRYNLCEAHFYIGVRKLADRNRTGAKDCFTRVVESGQYYFTESVWSRAFLANIDDPTWLPWLAEKK